MPTKQKKKPFVEEYAEATTIHGIPEVLLAQSTLVRVVWIAMFVLSIGGMTYQLVQLFTQFSREITASVLTKTSPTDWPEFTICPYMFMSEERLDELNVTVEMRYLLASILYTDTQSKFSNGATGNLTALQELQTLIDQFGSVDALMDQVSIAWDDVVSYTAPTLNNDTSDEARFMTARGMCFMMTSNETFNEVSASNAMQVIQLGNSSRINIYNNIFSNNTPEFLFLGGNGDNLRPYGEITIPNAYNAFIKITYMSTERPNLDRAPCRDWTEWDRIQCILKCERDLCVASNNCDKYVPGEGQTNISQLCSTELGRICSVDQTQCFNECPALCREAIYSATVTIYSESEDEAAALMFSFADPLNSMKIVESVIYDGNTMLSNVGGTVSLWSGASVLSFAQILYYTTLKRIINKEK